MKGEEDGFAVGAEYLAGLVEWSRFFFIAIFFLLLLSGLDAGAANAGRAIGSAGHGGVTTSTPSVTHHKTKSHAALAPQHTVSCIHPGGGKI